MGDFFKNCYIFTYTCPNGSGVGAIDRSYPAEHVFEPYCTLESSENFLWTRFGGSVLKRRLKTMFLALYKGFMHKTLIKGQKRLFLEGFSARIVPTMAMKNFLRTSSVQYGLKTCSGRSDLSIAPTPDTFRHVYVKI